MFQDNEQKGCSEINIFISTNLRGNAFQEFIFTLASTCKSSLLKIALLKKHQF